MTTPWKRIAAWYRTHGRDLPWRRTSDTYRIAVSEFMLQQTQVDRVVPLYRKFVAAFPSWNALASAPQADVVRAWKGLGYNLRAVRLRAIAQEIAARHGGKLPSDELLLLSLKGIGPYTARALRVFAFRQRALAPDTNVRRVLTRFLKGPLATPTVIDDRAWSSWETTLPEGLAYDVNQGLMDLGATVCKARRPLCPQCPLKNTCRSFPRILALKMLPKQKLFRKERVDAFGIPARIYRGRVIEALRHGPKSARALAFGAKVLPGLEKDGLIKKEKGRWRLA